MNNVQEEFIKLIGDKTKSPEDIYNIMYHDNKEVFSTKQILRGIKSWKNCLYQGTIGENDFIIAEASSTALDTDNIEMIYDDYKKTIIKFIEMFRQEYEKDPKKHAISIVINISDRFLSEVFAGASRIDADVRNQRNKVSMFDEKNQLRRYNISDQKGEGRTAVCCERNVTIGNVFQFMGFETYHVSGVLYNKDDDEILGGENHAFTLVKYGIEKGKYALFDIYNGIVIQNVLPGDYDFTNGFSIEYYSKKLKKTFIYEVDGPLFEMTDEILKIEIIVRNLSKRLQLSEYKYKHELDIEENLNVEKIKEEFSNLLNVIKDSDMNDIFKNRYINRIQTYYMKVIESIENNYNNISSVHHSK